MLHRLHAVKFFVGVDDTEVAGAAHSFRQPDVAEGGEARPVPRPALVECLTERNPDIPAWAWLEVLDHVQAC